MTSPSCMARDRVVDLVEVHGAGHHGADVELAVLDEADEPREVAPHLRAAVHAAEDPLLLEHGHGRDGDVGAELGHADHHRRAAGTGGVDAPGAPSPAVPITSNV